MPTAHEESTTNNMEFATEITSAIWTGIFTAMVVSGPVFYGVLFFYVAKYHGRPIGYKVLSLRQQRSTASRKQHNHPDDDEDAWAIAFSLTFLVSLIVFAASAHELDSDPLAESSFGMGLLVLLEKMSLRTVVAVGIIRLLAAVAIRDGGQMG